MRDAKKGTYNGQTTYCPVNGWDCPYYQKGVCHVDDPVEDCDDWIFFFSSWEEWEEANEEVDEEELEENHEWSMGNYDIEMGFDPYAGCYTDDC